MKWLQAGKSNPRMLPKKVDLKEQLQQVAGLHKWTPAPGAWYGGGVGQMGSTTAFDGGTVENVTTPGTVQWVTGDGSAVGGTELAWDAALKAAPFDEAKVPKDKRGDPDVKAAKDEFDEVVRLMKG